MKDFAAIDFETANGKRTSVCSVGLVVVRGGEICDKTYRLIRPRPNYYSEFCTRVHGLCYHNTVEAPHFPEVWREIAPLIQGLPLVAHNSPFDEGCLKADFRPVRTALSRLYVLLYLPRLAPHLRPVAPRPPTAHGRSSMRL